MKTAQLCDNLFDNSGLRRLRIIILINTLRKFTIQKHYSRRERKLKKEKKKMIKYIVRFVFVASVERICQNM